jgi:hypothetical protein
MRCRALPEPPPDPECGVYLYMAGSGPPPPGEAVELEPVAAGPAVPRGAVAHHALQGDHGARHGLRAARGPQLQAPLPVVRHLGRVEVGHQALEPGSARLHAVRPAAGGGLAWEASGVAPAAVTCRAGYCPQLPRPSLGTGAWAGLFLLLSSSPHCEECRILSRWPLLSMLSPDTMCERQRKEKKMNKIIQYLTGICVSETFQETISKLEIL